MRIIFLKKNIKYFLILFLFSTVLQAQSLALYVDPVNGDDLNAGTVDKPFKTIIKGLSALTASGTIYLRGGTYQLSATVRPSNSGSQSGYLILSAYPGEKPVLDFSQQPFSSSARGLYLSASYWKVYGLEIMNAGDNGVYISGSFNTVENCSIHDNKDTGLQIGGGGHDNRIINCDSYYNYNPPSSGDPAGGGNADGFSPKLDVGSNNYFYGCRSWQNSDDGWDGYLRPSNDVTTVLENCWTFKNGYLKDGTPSPGNGNGFKMGGSDNRDLAHNFILKNCLAFDNKVKGFDQNNNRGNMTLYNCTAYRNGAYNYSISLQLNAGKILTVKNSISLSPNGASFLTDAVQCNNSWSSGFSVSQNDFQSIDPSSAYGPRKADGSLPEIVFMHLQQGSSLIDAGVNVGIPFIGTSPDLGAFEFGMAMPTNVKEEKIPDQFSLFNNYPNPFNPGTAIQFSIPKSGTANVKIYDINGRLITELWNSHLNAGLHKLIWNGTNSSGFKVSSGNYFCMVSYNGMVKSQKLILLK